MKGEGEQVTSSCTSWGTEASTQAGWEESDRSSERKRNKIFLKKKKKLHGLLKELAKKIVFLKMAVKLGFVQIKKKSVKENVCSLGSEPGLRQS